MMYHLNTSFVLRNSISRKQFLKVFTLLAGTFALPIGFLKLAHNSTAPNEDRKCKGVRIRPLEGKTYTPSFLAFCERARFESVEHALRSVSNRNVEFSLETCDS